MEPTENPGPYQPRTPPMAEDDLVVQWLLQGDPAIRWQVLRDLVNASETEVATERARVEHEGWGARLLALRASDGLWANGAYFPGTAAFARATHVEPVRHRCHRRLSRREQPAEGRTSRGSMAPRPGERPTSGAPGHSRSRTRSWSGSELGQARREVGHHGRL